MTATPGRWLAAAVVVAAASFAGFGVARSWSVGPPPADLLRYPEVAEADRELVRSCWSALDRGRTALVVVSHEREAELERSFRDSPQRACNALLRVLCVWRFQPPIELSASSGAADRPKARLSVLLREHADAAAIRVLGRVAADGTLAPQARRIAVEAIARPDDSVAAEILQALALDRGVETWVRRDAVERLPRLRQPLSPRVHELLDEPLARLDEAAAVALLLTGDAEAPSLVVAALRTVAREGCDDRWTDAICGALRPLVAGDAEMEARIADPNSSTDALDVADAMDAWIAAHPDRFDTEFERARREPLASADRPHVPIEDVAFSAGDFDLGAALSRSDDPAWSADRDVERLDRLARAVRRDAGPNPTPQRWIEAMNERLLRRRPAPEWPVQESELGYVLRTGHGNCMGNSSLYLAVAERLGLPVHGVETPSHVFARWDDGKFRRNVECTQRGGECADASYDGRGGLVLAPPDVAKGAYLVNLTKRQFLALALCNRSARFLAADDPGSAAHVLGLALRLDPRCANALILRASCFARSPAAAERSAGVADARAAEAVRSLTPGEADAAADAYFAGGSPRDALRLADAVASAYPNSASVMALRAKALLALARRDESRAVARTALTLAGGDMAARSNTAEVLAVVGDEGWLRAFEAPSLPAVVACMVHMELAKRLLDGAPWHEPLPAAASTALDRVDALVAIVKANQDWSWAELRERTIPLRARCCRALGDDAGAKKAEAELARLGAR